MQGREGKKQTREKGNAGRRKRKGAKAQGRKGEEKKGKELEKKKKRRRIGKEMSKEGESRDQRYRHLSTQGPSRAHKLLE